MPPPTVRPVRSRRDRNDFLRFEWEANAASEHWVPPLLFDRRRAMDRKKNPFYQHAEAEFFIAEREGKVCGRIAAILNGNHNREHRENIGFFGFFECLDDQETADALFAAVSDWCAGKGLSAIRGPASPSVNHEYGLLIDGFDDSPTVMMSYNPPYYSRLIEGAGYRKTRDLFGYELNQETAMTERFVRVAGLLREREGITVRPLDMADFPNEVNRVRDLYTRAWQHNWGAVPMTEEEFRALAKDLRQFIRPELVLIAESKGVPVGFSLSLPDLNQAFRFNRTGWLLTGLLCLMLFRKKINRIRILVLGVLPDRQRSGAGSLLMYETARRAIGMGFHRGEASWVLENNDMMNRAAGFMNGRRTKVYRIYEKVLPTVKEQ